MPRRYLPRLQPRPVAVPLIAPFAALGVLLAFAALLFLLGGCSAPPAPAPPSWWDASIALDCDASIPTGMCEAVAATWNDALRGSARGVVIGTALPEGVPGLVFHVSEAAELPAGAGPKAVGHTAFGGAPSITFLPYWRSSGFAPDYARDLLFTILLHEVGHALGAGHLPASQVGVMSPQAEISKCVDDASASLVHGATGGC